MHERFARASLLILTAALLVALSAFAWRGWSARYFTDDFCSAAITRTRGFLETMQFQRAEWSGRFSYFVVKFPLERIGPETAKFTPAAMIVLMVGAAAWALRGLAVSRLLTWTLACAMAFAAIDSAPGRFDDYGPFVWETGALTYMLPTILFLVWMGMLVRGRGCATSFLLMLIAGGLSETTLAAQGAMTLGALLLTSRAFGRTAVAMPSDARGPRSCIALFGLLGTCTAMAISATAPGNETRLQGLAPSGSLVDAATQAVVLANQFIGAHLFVEGSSLLIVAGAGALLGASSRSIRVTVAAAVALVAAVCSIVAFFPSAWLLSAPPPPRAQYAASFFAIITVFAGAAALAARRRSERTPRFAAAVLLLLAIVPLWSALDTATTISAARRDAARRETIMRLLSTQRGKDIVLRSRWALESRYLGPDATDPNTHCIGSYYGLRSLRVTP